MVFSIFFTAYYVLTKNWIASNVYGEAFATSAIQLMDLDDFKTGMLLLSGLFFYDIFWVFGTEVMVSVAKNFDAPVKILFPKDLFAEKLSFTMLGLGDIVIPGTLSELVCYLFLIVHCDVFVTFLMLTNKLLLLAKASSRRY
jgi:minor histocompatibility antigen H13